MRYHSNEYYYSTVNYGYNIISYSSYFNSSLKYIMIVTFYERGCWASLDLWDYTVLCDNGVVFDLREAQYIRTGTRLVLPDDMCQTDSGWVEYQCDNCYYEFWTRTRPGGTITCPACSSSYVCVEDAIMFPFEGADLTDVYESRHST